MLRARRSPQREPDARASLLKRVSSKVGIDANVGWTFLARLANMGAGFASLFPVISCLSPVQQGYYYTFASIIALQTLFELGLTQILVQVTSHEFPFMPENAEIPAILGNPHGQRLSFFAAFANRWYATISCLFSAVGTVAGGFYFLHFGTLPVAQWLPQWIALIAFTSVNLYLSPRLAFVEGAGFPGKVAALRLRQTLIGYVLLMIALWAGLALWAVIAVPMTQAALSIRWLATHRSIPDFFRRPLRGTTSNAAWRREILDLQWRVALSWVGGYLSNLLFTPLLFANQGAAAAGRWGLTFSLMSQLTALGTSWTTAHTPRFGELIARGDRATLDREFHSATWKTVTLLSLACAGLIAVVWIAARLGIAAIHRVVGPGDLALMAAATVLGGVVFCLAIYVRAHKEEPLAASSLVIGGLTALSAWIGSHLGVTYVAAAYLAVTGLVNLPWRYVIYRRYRARTPAVAG